MRKIAPIKVASKIDRREFIQIPKYNSLISMFEPEDFKGYDWNETHVKLGEKKLQMPSQAIFIHHFVNVVRAHNRKSVLYDGLGNPLSEEKTDDLYRHFTSDHINRGAWSHLDSLFRFNKELGLWFMRTGHQVCKKNKVEFSYTEVPLQTCIMEEGFFTLKFNSQGLPIRRSKVREYRKGKNIYFRPPEDGSTARFDADSFWACIDCIWNPSASHQGLGTYIVAQ